MHHITSSVRQFRAAGQPPPSKPPSFPPLPEGSIAPVSYKPKPA